ITIVDERLEPQHHVSIAGPQRYGNVRQRLSQRRAVELDAARLLRAADANQVRSAIIAGDVVLGRGHNELTFANQVDLDKVNASIEKFSLLTSISFASRPSDLVCLTQY